MQAASKRELRRELLAIRGARGQTELQAARRAIADHVLDRCAERGWRTVAAYVPLRTEPGSVELLSRLTAAGVTVLVPVRLPDGDLDWIEWDAAGELDAMAGPGDRPVLGADAVARADAVLVPALAVATDGTRLGRGGGSYDRALGRVPAGVEVAAVVFSGEVVAGLPADPWDRPVGAAVTPDGWADLRG